MVDAGSLTSLTHCLHVTWAIQTDTIRNGLFIYFYFFLKFSRMIHLLEITHTTARRQL